MCLSSGSFSHVKTHLTFLIMTYIKIFLKIPLSAKLQVGNVKSSALNSDNLIYDTVNVRYNDKTMCRNLFNLAVSNICTCDYVIS